jgi:hypothetical protein
VWEERAYRARRDITAQAAEGLGVSDLHAAAIRLIEAKVGTDLSCWATIDPETLVISTMPAARRGFPPSMSPVWPKPSTPGTSRIRSPPWRIASNRRHGCPTCQTATAGEAPGSTTSGDLWGWSRSFASCS